MICVTRIAFAVVTHENIFIFFQEYVPCIKLSLRLIIYVTFSFGKKKKTTIDIDQSIDT